MAERLGYLNHEKQCCLCLTSGSQSRRGVLTCDHLVPLRVCKDYPKSLGKTSESSLERLDVNLLTICRKCHDDIDSDPQKGKTEMYRVYGILGITQCLVQYPRSKNVDILSRQHKQFQDLFLLLDKRFMVQIKLFEKSLEKLDQDLVGEILKTGLLRESFLKARQLVDNSLYKWELGDF